VLQHSLGEVEYPVILHSKFSQESDSGRIW